jgi:hypothetical protein
MRDLDFRSLCEAEAVQLSLWTTAPHQDKEWYTYFCTNMNGYMFLQMFLHNYGTGRGCRLDDFYTGFVIGKKSMGMESVKKKLQDGVDRKIIMRYQDESDARNKIYQLNNDIKNEIAELLVFINQKRLTNIMDAFEGVFTINIVKSWFQLFAERFGDGVASTIITTLTSAGPIQSLFANKTLNQRIKKAGKKFQVKKSK